MTEIAKYPVLPLRDIVVFPNMVIPLFVGREKSVRALEHVMENDKKILLVAQKDASDNDPPAEAIYDVGVIASVLQLLKLPDGTVKVLVEGEERARLVRFTRLDDYFEAEATIAEETEAADAELEALSRSVISQFESYVKLNKRVPPEVIVSINSIDDAAQLADTVASHLNIKISEKQELLEIFDVGDRLERVYALMEGEMSVLQVEKKIRNRVKRQMEKTQREYYLNEQMKAIQKELGESDDGRDELSELEDKIKKTKLSKEARTKADAELKKLRQMSPMSAESTVVRNYLDWLLSIPWSNRSKTKNDLDKAQDILDTDHYGLEKVKERILEYLAVQKRMGTMKGPILCLVGPPGVGKPRLGKSIATHRARVRSRVAWRRATKEIRGHRRTYIGSMPGKIIQSMKKAKKSNPCSFSMRSTRWARISAATRQWRCLRCWTRNRTRPSRIIILKSITTFRDVMFITTANSLNMPLRPC
ncbi:MAG: LON peptidase substrate-binding domain-containing protein [Parvularculaceae bacterium]